MAKSSRKDTRGYVLHTGETQRADGRYMFSYSAWNGKRQCVYAKTLAELREKEKQIRRDIDNGLDPGAADRITLNDLFDLYISQAFHLQDQTKFNYIHTYDRYVRPFFGKKPISRIRHSDLKKFYQSIIVENNIRLSTLENIHTPICSAFAVAVKDNILLKNPTQDVMREIKRSHNWNQKQRKSLSRAEQDAFMNALKSERKYTGWVPLLTVLLGSGMRIGECLALRWSDIDMENRLITVRHSFANRRFAKDGHAERHIIQPKTAAGIRVIPMLDEVYDSFLQEYESQCITGFCEESIDGFSGFVFVNERGKVYSPPSINRFIERARVAFNRKEQEAAEKEGREPFEIPHFSCHVLRHTFCTRAVEAGIELEVLRRIMGHKSLETTLEVYTDISQEKIQNAVDGMNGKIL